jgi:hypothetical protein
MRPILPGVSETMIKAALRSNIDQDATSIKLVCRESDRPEFGMCGCTRQLATLALARLKVRRVDLTRRRLDIAAEAVTEV